MSRLIEGSKDMTSRKHDFVTRDDVGEMVKDMVREALNVAIRRLADFTEQRQELIKAEILDELVAKGVLPPLEQEPEPVLS